MSNTQSHVTIRSTNAVVSSSRKNSRKSSLQHRSFASTHLEYEGGPAMDEDIADYYPRGFSIKGTVIA